MTYHAKLLAANVLAFPLKLIYVSSWKMHLQEHQVLYNESFERLPGFEILYWFLKEMGKALKEIGDIPSPVINKFNLFIKRDFLCLVVNFRFLMFQIRANRTNGPNSATFGIGPIVEAHKF